MNYPTKEYPEGSEIVISKISVTYSQVNEENENEDDHLKLSIQGQGAGFYYVMETPRWAFNSIAELDQILADFKAKANIQE